MAEEARLGDPQATPAGFGPRFEDDAPLRHFALPTLAPEPPVFDWLMRVVGLIGDRADAVVLDLSRTALHGPGIRALVQELQSRNLRVVGLVGLEAGRLGTQAAQLPPLLPHDGCNRPASLVIEGNVRSGQRVVHPDGDISVVGSVSSGAEVVAGGSVHIYGTLRGRALAGSGGDPAHIFCQRLDAEALVINGVVLAADDMEQRFLGQPVRAARVRDRIALWALDRA